MDYSTLKIGSIVEATLEDTVLCGIVIELDFAGQHAFSRNMKRSFNLNVLFNVGDAHADSHKCVLIDTAAITFIAPVVPDFYSVIDQAKSESMRWVFIHNNESSDPLTFADAIEDTDGLCYKDSDKARLKFMYLGEEFSLDHEEDWVVKRVA
jgi:hypothetical protein